MGKGNVSFLSGNGLGMRVIGGKEIPGTGGQLGAYVTRIYKGGVVESLGEIKEGTHHTLPHIQYLLTWSPFCLSSLNTSV
jgi:hypothetical protein